MVVGPIVGFHLTWLLSPARAWLKYKRMYGVAWAGSVKRPVRVRTCIPNTYGSWEESTIHLGRDLSLVILWVVRPFFPSLCSGWKPYDLFLFRGSPRIQVISHSVDLFLTVVGSSSSLSISSPSCQFGRSNGGQHDGYATWWCCLARRGLTHPVGRGAGPPSP